ncbi:MAG TPA: MMPL family transporter [Candidatus Cybelea sp.]|nr:MMPL family transporter [Candidatus Cybelea sp.]
MTLESVVFRAVTACERHAAVVIIALFVAAVIAATYVAHAFRMDTDTTNMISPTLAWRQKAAQFNALFPQNNGLLVIVVDGKTPDAAEDATAALVERLQSRPDLFASVRRPDGGEFFAQHGLLYLPTEQVQKISDSVIAAQPFIGSLTADPSLRGLFNTLSTFVQGVESNAIPVSRLEKPLAAISRTMSDALAGGSQPMSWQTLLIDQPPDLNQLRHLILAQPKRDFTALKPGAAASQFVRDQVKALGLTADSGVTVRLTGPVALNDEEFGTVAEGMGLALAVSTVLVLAFLYGALRSAKLIVASAATLLVGLILTFAFAFLAIGSLNLISVAFAVMFIGLSIDFGIQFGVRYGQERFESAEADAPGGSAPNGSVLARTGRSMARPLTLAAAAIAVGFASFMPTDYRGVSELGLIALAGMAITLVLNFTLLPAILTLLKPRTTPREMGFARAKGIDLFLIRYRWPVVAVWAVLTVAGLALSPRLMFDFNPLHLKDPHTESMSTMLDLMRDPLRTPYEAELLVPNLDAADQIADKLQKLPEVHAVVTAHSLVPADQQAKLAILADLKDLMSLSLEPVSVAAPPSDDDVRAAFRTCAKRLREAMASSDIARQLARLLDQAAEADPSLYPKLKRMLIDGLMPRLSALKDAMNAGPISIETLPAEIKRDWIASDGEVRIAVFPSGDDNNSENLARFVTALRSVAPDVTGPAVQIYESGRAVSHAFRTATLTALVTATLLLVAVLRRLRDVLYVLAPLLAAGATVILICVLAGIQLNYANIIALPLLLGIGIAFDIYFAVNWRRGVERPLSTSTARAVLFSALATGSSFGGLALSNHPGTAGIGQLLLLSLAVVLATIFTFMPALMGPPASSREDPGSGA